VLMTIIYVVAGVHHAALFGLATGLLGVVPFGAMVALVAVAAQPWQEFEGQEAGLAQILENIVGSTWPGTIIAAGAVISIFSVTLVTLYGQTRILFAMGRDGMLPPRFAQVNAKTQTPVFNTIVVAIVVSILAALVPLDRLADLVSIGTLLAFISVCVGIMILRKTAPKIRRKFRTPWVWVVAPAGIITCGVMMFSLSNGTWWRLVIWTAIGFIIYFAYGIRNAAPSKWSVSDES